MCAHNKLRICNYFKLPKQFLAYGRGAHLHSSHSNTQHMHTHTLHFHTEKAYQIEALLSRLASYPVSSPCRKAGRRLHGYKARHGEEPGYWGNAKQASLPQYYMVHAFSRVDWVSSHVCSYLQRYCSLPTVTYTGSARQTTNTLKSTHMCWVGTVH